MSDTGFIANGEPRYDKHGVFFGIESAPDSWSGHLSGETSISEAQIVEFVKHGNRKLFEKLRGMPFKSSDIPHKYNRYQFLHSTTATIDDPRVKTTGSDNYEEAFQSLQFGDSAIHNDVATLEGRPLRQLIQICLSNGAAFMLRRLPADGPSLECYFPECLGIGRIQPQTLYLELNHDPSARSSSPQQSNPILFHVKCLDILIDTKCYHPLPRPRSTTDLSLSLDGVDHETVVKAAGRLRIHKTTADQDTDTPTRPDFAWKHPYNSEEAWELRSQKDHDIEDVLREVAKFEHNTAEYLQESRSSSPDLLITPPPYMEPARERYKKQGLSPYDQKISNQKRAEVRKASGLSDTVDSERSLANSIDQRHCYCSEPDDGQSDMIRCSSTWCTVGWFHLRCTNLSRLPIIGEKFYCEYCRDDFGPFKPLTADHPEKGTDSVSTTTMTDESESDYEQLMVDNDWDDSEEDPSTNAEESEEPTVVIQSAMASWGTPINSPEGRRLEVERLICKPSSPTRPNKQSRQWQGE